MDTALAVAGDIGPWAALVALVAGGLRAILSGQLVPRRTVDLLTEAWEGRLADKRDQLAASQEREAQWREAWLTESAAGDVRDAQVARLMTYAETADRVLQNLPRKGA